MPLGDDAHRQRLDQQARGDCTYLAASSRGPGGVCVIRWDVRAEREGFEPPGLVGLPLSRRVRLSALPPFRVRGYRPPWFSETDHTGSRV